MALSLLILLASPLAVSGLSLTPVVGGTVGAGYASEYIIKIIHYRSK